MTRKLYVKTYGCQMNVYDSQRMADTLAPEGFAETATPDDADLIILNTCHIREKAAEKVYSELGRMRELKEDAAREGRDVTIAVAGCVAQAEGEEILRRAPAVDLVVGPQSYHRLPEMLTRAAHGKVSSTPSFRSRTSSAMLAAPSRAADPQARRVGLPHRAGRLRQVLHLLRRALYARRRSVAAGRDDRRRGASAWPTPACARSRCSARTSTPITARARTAAPATLGRLLHRLADIPGIARLRYTTSHPRDMDDDLIAAHRDLPALMP